MLAASKIQASPASRHVAEWTSVEKLGNHKERWARLAANAIEPNPFYEQEWLSASVRELRQEDISCVAIYDCGARDSNLIGLFPLQPARLLHGAIIPSLEFYRNDFVCSTAPLIDKSDPVGVWHSFFDAFNRDRPMPRIVISQLMPANSVLKSTLDQALEERALACAVVGHFERAAVAPEGQNYDTYVGKYSARRTKDLRRRNRKLGELGNIRISTVHGGSEAQTAIADFLRIEQSGWKGKKGTAMASSASDKAFALSVFAAENVDFDVVSLDGNAIAVAVNLVRNGAIFTVKTAFDEAYSACSPGVMLDLQLVRNCTSGRYERADSCAIANHPVEGYWLEKQQIESLVIAVNPAVSASRVESLASTLRNVARLKNWLKDHIRPG